MQLTQNQIIFISPKRQKERNDRFLYPIDPKVYINVCNEKRVLIRVLNMIFFLAEKESIAVYISLMWVCDGE